MVYVMCTCAPQLRAAGCDGAEPDRMGTLHVTLDTRTALIWHVARTPPWTLSLRRGRRSLSTDYTQTLYAPSAADRAPGPCRRGESAYSSSSLGFSTASPLRYGFLSS